MKKQIVFLSFVLGLFFTLSLWNGGIFAQTNTDEAAIKNTIAAEKAASDAADYNAYKSHWASVPYASFLIYGEQYVGDALWKKADEVWANKKPEKINTIRKNWNVRVKGEAAFVTFEQRDENLDTKALRESVEARYLEKIGGEWKIVNVSVLSKPSKK